MTKTVLKIETQGTFVSILNIKTTELLTNGV